jgi:hypothetical protein
MDIICGNMQLQILSLVVGKLHLVEFIVLPLLGKQLFMHTLFHYAAIDNNDDTMSISDGG